MPIDTTTPPLRPPNSKGAGNWLELRIGTDGRLYTVDPDNPDAPAVVRSLLPSDLAQASTTLASADAFLTATAPVVRFGGSDFIRKVGSVSPSTPGYNSVVFPSANGRYYQLFYKGFTFNSEDFNIIGDNTADDTVALQNFATALGTFGAEAVFPANKVFKTSGTVTFPRGVAGVYMPASSSIKPTGSGYTAVVIENQFQWSRFRLKVVGTDNAVNGIQINNAQRTTFEHLEAENLSGFGVQINKSWDCTFLHISTNFCGNANNYAFHVSASGDSTNMTTFVRVQVENSREKAANVEGNNLGLTFLNIHSEGTVSTTTRTDSWVLAGVHCTYMNTRLHAAGNATESAKAGMMLSGSQTKFINLRAEGAFVNMTANAFDTDGWGRVTLDTLSLTSGKLVKTGNGYVDIEHSTINIFEGFTTNVVLRDCRIGLLKVGFSPTTPLFAFKCEIVELDTVDATSRAELTDCNVYSGKVLTNTTVLRRTSFWPTQSNTSFTIGFCVFHLLEGSQIFPRKANGTAGSVTINTAHFRTSGYAKINGDLIIPANNGIQNEFDPTFRVSGTVSGMAVNNAGQYALFTQGARNYNPKPTPGGVEYWYYTGSAWIAVNYPAQP